MHNRVRYICVVLLSFILILPLTGCSAVENHLLTSKQEALAHAQKLLPEFFEEDGQLEGSEQSVTVEHSSERNIITPAWWSRMFYQEDSWTLSWENTGRNKGNINVDLAAEDGALTSFSYYPEIPSEADVDKLLSREEAEQIAYDFAVRCHPDKMTNVAPHSSSSQYATDFQPGLEYSFGWERVIEGFPAPGNGINVGVNALTGAITQLNCSWDEALPAPERVVGSEKLAQRIVDQSGLYLIYVEDGIDDNGFPKAKPVYGLNTMHRQFNADSGAPDWFYGEIIPWAEARSYHGKYTPVSAPEQKVTIPMPDERKTLEETKAIAASFLKRLNIEGELYQGGRRWDSGPPFPQEVLHFRLSSIEHYHPQWKEVEVSINTATGMVESFSRKPKENSSQSPLRQLARAQAQDLALKFLADIKVDTSNMASGKYANYYNYPFMTKSTHDSYNFYWMRLVNGIPFPSDNVRVSVSRNTGEVLSFERSYSLVSTFETIQGIISPEEAAAAWAAAQPLKLQYGQTGNLFAGKPKMGLLYNLTGVQIDAHTGEIIENQNPDPKLGPYLAKVKGHWAEIPLGLLAQTGNLPAVEEFAPDKSVTRREGLRILDPLTHSSENYEDKRLHTPFQDVSINDPDIWAILNNVWGGIIEPGGSLEPEEPLTRGEAAVWLDNLANSKKTGVGTPASAGSISRQQDPISWGEFATLVLRTISSPEY